MPLKRPWPLKPKRGVALSVETTAITAIILVAIGVLGF